MPPFSTKPRPSPREAAKVAKRETRREVRSSQRDIDREIRELERQEKQILSEIKIRAKQPGVDGANDAGLKTMAKQLVQVRAQREKMFQARAHLGAVSMQASSMASQVAAAAAVGSVASAMTKVNSVIDAKEMAKIMSEFTKQTELMNVREEMMDDALIDAFDSDAVDEEAEAITSQVLAELGVELDSKMSYAPSSRLATQNQHMLPDLKARLDVL